MAGPLNTKRSYEAQEIFGRAADSNQKVSLKEYQRPHRIWQLAQEINIAGANRFMDNIKNKLRDESDRVISLEELAKTFVETGIASCTEEAKKLIPRIIDIDIFYSLGLNFYIEKTKRKDGAYRINVWDP